MEVKLNNIAKIFSSRDRAHQLFDSLPDGDALVLDFEGVEQVTPSFLHELLAILRNKNATLETKNISESNKMQLKKAELALS